MNAYWLSNRQSNDKHVFQENRIATNRGRSDILRQKWTFFHNGTFQAWTPYVRENSKCKASLSLIFLFKGGGWNKKLTWFSHLLVFFLTMNKQRKRLSFLWFTTIAKPFTFLFLPFHAFFLAFLIIPPWFMVPQPIPQASQGHPWVLLI